MGSCLSKGPAEEGTVVSVHANGNKKPRPSDTGSGAKDASQAAGSSPDAPDFHIQDTHQVLSLLGRGGTGETWLCRSKEDAAEVAIKFIKRPILKMVAPMIRAEISIQGAIGEGNINIISAQEALLTSSHLALIMEYAAGGSLTQYVSDRWDTVADRGGLFLSEEEARYFFRQFVGAVEYCHEKHVAHRDLKLDNTLLDGSDPPLIKICDFGFAKEWGDNEAANMLTTIGTPVYMSPQLINSKSGTLGYSGKASDVWACGVMLFVMLLGMFPFEHSEHPDPNTSAAHVEVWLQQVKTSWREAPRVASAAAKLSPACRDLLDRAFDLNEKLRITIEEVKAHPWYNEPLLPVHDKALRGLEERQAALTLRAASASKKSQKREFQLDMMMKEAIGPLSSMAHSDSRVDLRRLDPDSMAAEGVITEDEVVVDT